MLMPKRTKFRKVQRGRMKGAASRGNKVSYGEFGIQAMEPGWSTAGETARDLGFGAGMGLPNMKKYSDEMDIQSTVGVGTTVTMTILMN